MSFIRTWPVRIDRESGAVPDNIHAPFLYTALAFALAAGLVLAVTLPVQAALGRMSVSWVAHAQVHGHIQVVGFAGLFVVGVAYKLAPRFGSGHLAFPHLIPLTWWLLVAALILRTVGQPVAHEPAFATLMTAGAVLEVAGAACFAATMLATLRPSLASGAPHALLLGGASLWLLVQAALGAWWLTELALDGGTVLASGRNGVLLTVQMFGFLLAAFIGVGYRSFPSLFGMPPPSPRLATGAVLLLHGGLLGIVGAGLAREGGWDARPLATCSHLLLGAAILVAISAFGCWRRETRFAIASQPLSLPLRAALLWLTVAGVLLVATAASALAEGRPMSLATADAIRHIFAIGVITLGITAMAQLILPEFASERITRPTAAWRGAGFALVLSVAVILRAFAPLAGIPSPLLFWSMALGGLLTLGAMIAFALLLLRAGRTHREHQRRIARYRAHALPTVDRNSVTGTRPHAP